MVTYTKKEYDFLYLIANALEIDSFKFISPRIIAKKVIQSEFKRIEQFYRLALLMHSDGVLHEKGD
jgi:hypothetical protein